MNAPLPLADLPSGFAAPGPASQVVFRCVLDALSHPGRRYTLPPAGCAALVPPAGMSTAMAALLLTLLDAEVSLWLSPSFDQPMLRSWLSFHTGVSFATDVSEARFVALRAAELDRSLWTRLATGSDEQPQDGATVLVDTDALTGGAPLLLSGPGLAVPTAFAPAGIALDVWQQRRDDQRRYPLGADLLLCEGAQLAGLPRSTRLSLEG